MNVTAVRYRPKLKRDYSQAKNFLMPAEHEEILYQSPFFYFVG
jgi:hypothetical protein